MTAADDRPLVDAQSLGDLCAMLNETPPVAVALIDGELVADCGARRVRYPDTALARRALRHYGVAP